MTGVFVVGMHRSGTTAVTRTINLMGVPTCVESDLAPGWIGNPEGHWESLTLMRTDDALLREVGAAWWCPPPVVDGLWTSSRIERMRPVARAEFDAVHPTAEWVAKDPRVCVTLPFWRQALDRPARRRPRHPGSAGDRVVARDARRLPAHVRARALGAVPPARAARARRHAGPRRRATTTCSMTRARGWRTRPRS